jgi:hypothetical protein
MGEAFGFGAWAKTSALRLRTKLPDMIAGAAEKPWNRPASGALRNLSYCSARHKAGRQQSPLGLFDISNSNILYLQ